MSIHAVTATMVVPVARAMQIVVTGYVVVVIPMTVDLGGMVVVVTCVVPIVVSALVVPAVTSISPIRAAMLDVTNVDVHASPTKMKAKGPASLRFGRSQSGQSQTNHRHNG